MATKRGNMELEPPRVLVGRIDYLRTRVRELSRDVRRLMKERDEAKAERDMMLLKLDVMATLTKADRRKIAILFKMATSLKPARERSRKADQKYAAIAWALDRIGVVEFDPPRDISKPTETISP